MKKIEVAAAIIENDNGEILICKRAPGSSLGGLWEFPGGKREPGESFEQCVTRECHEELEINLEALKEFTKFDYQYPDTHIKFVFFKARISSGAIRKNVHNDVKWVSKSEIENYPFCPADKEIVNRLRDNIRVIRVKEEFERAGAYYVRIQAMARKYGITLREEFDEIDGPDCNYILLLDGEFPAATCRWFKTSDKTAEIGRVVVLPEYRGKGLGRLAVSEAEKHIAESGFEKIEISSREEAVGFYEKLGYSYNKSKTAHSGTFKCVYMEKLLTNDKN